MFVGKIRSPGRKRVFVDNRRKPKEEEKQSKEDSKNRKIEVIRMEEPSSESKQRRKRLRKAIVTFDDETHDLVDVEEQARHRLKESDASRASNNEQEKPLEEEGIEPPSVVEPAVSEEVATVLDRVGSIDVDDDDEAQRGFEDAGDDDDLGDFVVDDELDDELDNDIANYVPKDSASGPSAATQPRAKKDQSHGAKYHRPMKIHVSAWQMEQAREIFGEDFSFDQGLAASASSPTCADASGLASPTTTDEISNDAAIGQQDYSLVVSEKTTSTEEEPSSISSQPSSKTTANTAEEEEKEEEKFEKFEALPERFRKHVYPPSSENFKFEEVELIKEVNWIWSIVEKPVNVDLYEFFKGDNDQCALYVKEELLFLLRSILNEHLEPAYLIMYQGDRFPYLHSLKEAAYFVYNLLDLHHEWIEITDRINGLHPIVEAACAFVDNVSKSMNTSDNVRLVAETVYNTLTEFHITIDSAVPRSETLQNEGDDMLLNEVVPPSGTFERSARLILGDVVQYLSVLKLFYPYLFPASSSKKAGGTRRSRLRSDVLSTAIKNGLMDRLGWSFSPSNVCNALNSSDPNNIKTTAEFDRFTALPPFQEFLDEIRINFSAYENTPHTSLFDKLKEIRFRDYMSFPAIRLFFRNWLLSGTQSMNTQLSVSINPKASYPPPASLRKWSMSAETLVEYREHERQRFLDWLDIEREIEEHKAFLVNLDFIDEFGRVTQDGLHEALFQRVFPAFGGGFNQDWENEIQNFANEFIDTKVVPFLIEEFKANIHEKATKIVKSKVFNAIIKEASVAPLSGLDNLRARGENDESSSIPTDRIQEIVARKPELTSQPPTILSVQCDEASHSSPLETLAGAGHGGMNYIKGRHAKKGSLELMNSENTLHWTVVAPDGEMIDSMFTTQLATRRGVHEIRWDLVRAEDEEVEEVEEWKTKNIDYRVAKEASMIVNLLIQHNVDVIVVGSGCLKAKRLLTALREVLAECKDRVVRVLASMRKKLASKRRRSSRRGASSALMDDNDDDDDNMVMGESVNQAAIDDYENKIEFSKNAWILPINGIHPRMLSKSPHVLKHIQRGVKIYQISSFMVARYVRDPLGELREAFSDSIEGMKLLGGLGCAPRQDILVKSVSPNPLFAGPFLDSHRKRKGILAGNQSASVFDELLARSLNLVSSRVGVNFPELKLSGSGMVAHTTSLAHLPGSGPKLARDLLIGEQPEKEIGRIELLDHLGRDRLSVWLNLCGFLIMGDIAMGKTQASRDNISKQRSPFDATRITPEQYDNAKGVLTNAFNIQPDQHQKQFKYVYNALRAVRESASGSSASSEYEAAMEQLDFEAWANQMKEADELGLRYEKTLLLIREELLRPYFDPRVRRTIYPSDSALFEWFSRESVDTLQAENDRGERIPVFVNIIDVMRSRKDVNQTIIGFLCRLTGSNLPGFLRLVDVNSSYVKSLQTGSGPDQLSGCDPLEKLTGMVGRALWCTVLDIDYEDVSVLLAWDQQNQLLIDEDWDGLLSNTTVMQQVSHAHRRVDHPSWADGLVSCTEAARILLSDADKKRVIFHPSRGKHDHHWATMRGVGDVVGNIEIIEREKTSPDQAELSNRLEVNGVIYEDLDEILARVVAPIQYHSKCFMDSRNHWTNMTTMTDIDTELKKLKREAIDVRTRPGQSLVPLIPWSVSATVGHPFHIMLAFAPNGVNHPRAYEVIHEDVKISELGIRFRDIMFASFVEWANWFKKNFWKTTTNQ